MCGRRRCVRASASSTPPRWLLLRSLSPFFSSGFFIETTESALFCVTLSLDTLQYALCGNHQTSESFERLTLPLLSASWEGTLSNKYQGRYIGGHGREKTLGVGQTTGQAHVIPRDSLRLHHREHALFVACCARGFVLRDCGGEGKHSSEGGGRCA